jgi:hydrogenase nickel incorporation protein HypB
VLVIENVGNLVCPAAWDLGEDLRVTLLSVTEGEDKPLKYPRIFKDADAIVINKIDIAEAVGFDRERALESVRLVAPGARVFELSARTGAGMAPWLAYLRERGRQARPDPRGRSGWTRRRRPRAASGGGCA